MLGIVGTVPDADLGLLHGPARMDGGRVTVAGRELEVQRGTPALLAAALQVAAHLGRPEIHASLAGDTGRGDGSRHLYDWLCRHLPDCICSVLVFHYLQPDVDWHGRVLLAIEQMTRPPVLIADAGFMYAAKMSGQAGRYDCFTPDLGELAFLADEQAPHPFYTRGFILHESNRADDLIERAYRHDNAAIHLLVKGATDAIVARGRVVDRVDAPSTPAMEAIGGTGDTLTGLLAALCAAGHDLVPAASLAARANRLCGALARPTPASPVSELIAAIPRALADLGLPATPA
ncbi:NAD(P)H-hydrate dehydratase [uncultured Desulfobulbus sp.]|uniref:NAD(P)H-hydrate dehydratase n=1 Tax=uncultured Desulfobulbus sp. TaxID=239745 RepID=UPI00261FCE44|nr:NAD(P)H-hydrate dehydratase [uncultured Desulfobulbus sp.]